MINIQKCLSVLGYGSSAVVKEAFERRTHKQVAVKMSRKEKRPMNNSEPDYLMKEMDIPKNLDHPCITKVLEVQSEKLFVIVMELATGEELGCFRLCQNPLNCSCGCGYGCFALTLHWSCLVIVSQPCLDFAFTLLENLLDLDLVLTLPWH